MLYPYEESNANDSLASYMSYVKIWIHAVWGTKKRIPFLKPPTLEKVCDHIRANAENKGIFIDSINGHDDHLHVLMLLKSEYSIAKQIQLLKGESAFWVNKNKIIDTKFEWADKYFASSVSDDKVERVRKYIRNQQEHHRKSSFAEEYERFLSGVGYQNVDFLKDFG